MKIIFFVTLLVTLVLSAGATRFIIPILKSKKMGQKILDIGPRWHKSKEGTPTMGGIAFIFAMTVTLIAAVVVSVLTGVIEDAMIGGFLKSVFISFGFAIACGLIGIIDDRAKLSHNQNEGLKAHEKYLLQLVAAGLYLFLASFFGLIDTVIYIPFVDFSFDAGFFYYPVMLILITGVVNSVNLTDGIDGLASSISVVTAAFFAVISFVTSNPALSLLSAVMIGGCLGFLVFNFYPARVFMGDTGSLFLGGLLISLAFLANNPFISLICGIVFIIETASVMLQVGYFKLTHGKRLFKMTPIHHHFEKCGWSEIKIVSVFSLVSLLFSVLAYFGMGL